MINEDVIKKFEEEYASIKSPNPFKLREKVMAELKVDEFVGTIAEQKLLLKTVDTEVDRLCADARLQVRSQRTMIDDKFKRALFADATVTGEQELERMYVKAYADGHSGGFRQIAYEFDELDDMVADILKLRFNLK